MNPPTIATPEEVAHFDFVLAYEGEEGVYVPFGVAHVNDDDEFLVAIDGSHPENAPPETLFHVLARMAAMLVERPQSAMVRHKLLRIVMVRRSSLNDEDEAEGVKVASTPLNA